MAFILLHPVLSQLAGDRNSGSSPNSTILSRHEGSSFAETSAATLVTHITTSLLPQVISLLSRLRTENLKRGQDRTIREEQDCAFAETEKRDKKHILKRLGEERALQEAERKHDEERAAREATRISVAAWRRYARRKLIVPEPSIPSQGLRMVVRLSDGKRVIRLFSREDTTDSVYAFAETLLIPAGEEAGDDPTGPPQDYGEHEWSFGIVTGFPRMEIPASKDVSLWSIPELKGGANLMLEMKSAFLGSTDSEMDSDSDESDADN